MKKEFQPFITSDEHRNAVAQWRKSAERQEKDDPMYDDKTLLASFELGNVPMKGISDIARQHNFSPIRFAIEQIEQGCSLPFKALDIGGGIGIYASQIKHELESLYGPGICRIYTTGLRKKFAAEQRRKFIDEGITMHPRLQGVKKEMDKNLVRWRSVLELHNFPEFHLILDTFGEVLYGRSTLGSDEESLQRYMFAICHKLLPGGMASIAGAFGEAKVLMEEAHSCGCRVVYDHEHSIKVYKPQTKDIGA